MLSSDLLEGFLAIVDAGGFSKAATQLNVSQPAISQRLRRLEVEVGRPLLHRDGNEIRLTPEGIALLPHARAVMQAMADAELHLHNPLLSGSVRLGIAEDIAGSTLPDVLGRFRRAHPGVRLTIETGLSGNLSDRLTEGEFDLVLGKRAGTRHQGVLWTEPLVWAVAPEFQSLAKHRPLLLALHPRPSVTAEAVFAVLRRADIDFFVMLTSPSIAGLRAGVLAGLGISAFGQHFIPVGLREVTPGEAGLPALPGLEFGLEQRRGKLPPAVEVLAEFIRKEAKLTGLRISGGPP